MTVKLKKQVIAILKVLQEKKTECIASELAEELKIDYIVLMSAVNDLIDQGLGGFKEVEIDQITLNEEGLKYLKNSLPERQIIQIFANKDTKEITLEDLKKQSQLEEKIFYIGLNNMKRNRWIATSKTEDITNVIYTFSESSKELPPETDLEKFLQNFDGTMFHTTLQIIFFLLIECH